ncbi:14302_t:CDS:2, partial [Rhizophagus irregularis]
MTAVGIAAPIFHGREDEDLKFDAKLTGKNWKLSSIRLVAAVNGGAGATRRAFRALAIPEVANGIYI